jgi:hypothetical protein
MPARAASSITAVRSAWLEDCRLERSPRRRFEPGSRQRCAGITYSSRATVLRMSRAIGSSSGSTGTQRSRPPFATSALIHSQPSRWKCRPCSRRSSRLRTPAHMPRCAIRLSRRVVLAIALRHRPVVEGPRESPGSCPACSGAPSAAATDGVTPSAPPRRGARPRGRGMRPLARARAGSCAPKLSEGAQARRDGGHDWPPAGRADGAARARRPDRRRRNGPAPATSLLPAACEHLVQITTLRAPRPAPSAQRDVDACEAEAAMLMGQLVWDASRRRTRPPRHSSTSPSQQRAERATRSPSRTVSCAKASSRCTARAIP